MRKAGEAIQDELVTNPQRSLRSFPSSRIIGRGVSGVAHGYSSFRARRLSIEPLETIDARTTSCRRFTRQEAREIYKILFGLTQESAGKQFGGPRAGLRTQSPGTRFH